MSKYMSEDFLSFYNGNTSPIDPPKTEEIVDLEPNIFVFDGPKCELCNKPLDRKIIYHENICQTKSKHSFCSKACKNKWCNEQSLN